MKKNGQLPQSEVSHLQALRRQAIANRRHALLAKRRGEGPGSVKFYRWDRRLKRLVPHRCPECGR